MKVTELSGQLLNYWVAKAEGLEPYYPLGEDHIDFLRIGENPSRALPAFAADWSQGGPIIERESIATYRQEYSDGTLREWCAGPSVDFDDSPVWRGDAPLVAAMRYFVASKYGDTVPDQHK